MTNLTFLPDGSEITSLSLITTSPLTIVKIGKPFTFKLS